MVYGVVLPCFTMCLPHETTQKKSKKNLHLEAFGLKPVTSGVAVTVTEGQGVTTVGVLHLEPCRDGFVMMVMGRFPMKYMGKIHGKSCRCSRKNH